MTLRRDERVVESRWTMTAPAFPERGARKPSARFTAWTRAAICKAAARAWAWPSRATSRARMAAISCWTKPAGRIEGDDPLAGLISPWPGLTAIQSHNTAIRKFALDGWAQGRPW